MSAAHGAPPRGRSDFGAADMLSLVVGGKEWAGWQRVAVTRAMEQVPASFDIQVTEKYPQSGDINIKPGDPCQVKIGGDLVITGYVDRYTAAITPTEHSVRIEGRSKSQDLVDCAAFIGTPQQEKYNQLSGTTLSIAQQLAKPYGVTINSTAGPGVQIPVPININPGETAWEIIERITRYSKLIAYDLPDGSIVLSQTGTESMGSGFKQGDNIEQAGIMRSMDQRYSLYKGYILPTQVYTVDQGIPPADPGVTITDDDVPRFRKRIIICEQFMLGQPIIRDRVLWEKNRRAARSQAVTLTCDSWRDANGKLWGVNCIAPVELPALKLPQASWLIGSVTYTRDESGQHAHVLLMDKAAFEPEPTALNPNIVLTTDVARNNPTARDAPSAPSSTVAT